MSTATKQTQEYLLGALQRLLQKKISWTSQLVNWRRWLAFLE